MLVSIYYIARLFEERKPEQVPPKKKASMYPNIGMYQPLPFIEPVLLKSPADAIYIPRKHTKMSYRAQQRAAKKRRNR